MFDDEELVVGTKVVVHTFWRNLVVGLISLIILAFVGGFVYFTTTLETRRLMAENAPQADGIVALTGGKERLKAGFDLLLAQKGGRLLISGVGDNVTVDDLRAELGVGNTMPEVARFGCCIDLDHSQNTIENATAAHDWVQAQNFSSILVVTSAYHMPRALVEFSAVMPGVTLQPYPVQSDAVRLDEWWAYPGTMLLIGQEYVKTIAAYVRRAVMGG